MMILSDHNQVSLPPLRRRIIRRRSHTGQALLIAIGVLFLLGFLSALFSIIVVQNLQNAQRQTQTLTADYYAQAGLNYANSMLLTSPLGADWRPPLQCDPTSANFTPSAAATSLPSAVQPSTTAISGDPDQTYLQEGFTRYNLQNGRFLLRITFDPNLQTSGFVTGTPATNLSSPTAKYLKIEVVGKLGVVDKTDPTTFLGVSSHTPMKQLVAYKPIGIVDYSRFITNKDSRTDVARLGVPSSYVANSGGTGQEVVTPGVYDFDPANLSTGAYLQYPITTTYGSATDFAIASAPGSSPGAAATAATARGGSLRCNGSLRLYGLSAAYLNAQYGDDWEIAGSLAFDDQPPTGTTTQTPPPPAGQLQLIGTDENGTAYSASPANPVLASSSASFNTFGGLIRDGNGGSDQNGYPRQIQRLNPPVIDSTDPATGENRYQSLAGVSAANPVNPLPATPSTTAEQTPATILVDNSSDIQKESTQTLGGRTLRNDWLHHASDTGGSWQGSYYDPPGVVINFGQIAANTGASDTNTGLSTAHWGITMTRSDVDSNEQAKTWGYPAATAIKSQTAYFVYDSSATETGFDPASAGAPIYFLNAGVVGGGQLPAPSNDIVIYAEGNVRVRGVVSTPSMTAGNLPQHITIVTDGIAYIDGSILKGDPRASIAILAKQYVCLNTTQFLAGAQTSSTGYEAPEYTESPDLITFNTGNEVLGEESVLPVPYDTYGSPATGSGSLPGSTPYSTALYVTESSNEIGSEAPGTPTQSDGSYNISYLPAALPTQNSFTALQAVAGGQTIGDVEPLTGGLNLDSPFLLSFEKNQSIGDSFVLERAAILPGDIHIEASLYAQDNSFFLIPGDWFNENPSDTVDKASGISTGYNRPGINDPRFPFFGQPIDLKITIYGSVSENLPANISDQALWMQKWGWIPKYHGFQTSSIEASPHDEDSTGTSLNNGVGVGLNITYDPLNGLPYFTGTNNLYKTAPAGYLRVDTFGRPLAFAPALPVSPDLLYSGSSS